MRGGQAWTFGLPTSIPTRTLDGEGVWRLVNTILTLLAEVIPVLISGLTLVNQQTPGEDPLRIKGYVKALLKGLEGNSSIRKMIATCKHYAAYALERWNGVVRYGFNAIVTLQDLSEYYLPPFQQKTQDTNKRTNKNTNNTQNGTP